MNVTIVDVLFYMSITAVLGCLFDWLCGGQIARRACAEAMVRELRERLEQPTSKTSQDLQLTEMRHVLNDAHKHIVAVSKGLKNKPR